MKKIVLLVLLILVVIAGLTAGPAIVNYDGYFLVVLESGTFQLSIFGFVFFLVCLFVVGWLGVIVVKRLIKIVSGSQDWLFGFGQRRKQKAFTTGLISLAEGNYLEARKQLGKITDADFDGVNLLAAAEAEARLGDKTAAQDLWQQATLCDRSSLAAHLCIIRDHLSRNESQQALTHIRSLDSHKQSKPNVIKLWAHALDQCGKYSELKDKLSDWKKPLGDEYERWALQASKGEFAEIASKEGANRLKERWKELPRSVRKEPTQRAAFAQQLIEQAMYEDAQEILVEGQKQGPVPVLYELYRLLKTPHPTAAIKQLESWLKVDDKNVELLSVLAELAFNSGDGLLAEKVLNKAIKLGNQRRDVLLLARIKESQNDSLHALELYKKSAN